jgi:hypothetical protein
MPAVSASLAATVIVLVLIALLAGTALHVWRQKKRQRRRERAMEKLARAIAEYFRLSGTEVQVECVAKPDGQTLLALIDSEPQPRFRYSHLIEIALRAHVQRHFGVELTRVYWRFAIREVNSIALAAAEGLPTVPPAQPAPQGEDRALEEDSYLNQRRMHEKLEQEYQVGHTTWESFEAARGDTDSTRR